MARNCSNCGQNGHNTRTCLNKRSVKLFGVNISNDPISPPDVTALRKSVSLGNIESLLDNGNVNGDPIAAVEDTGYHSDGQIHSKKRKFAHEKSKGKPWTEEEHRSFLMGLKRNKKGDWRSIAKSFVKTRTPTQVASHAQKYFIRLNANEKRKRRASLFDLSLDNQEKGNNSPQVTISSLKTPSKQPITGAQEPVQGFTQTEISNRFKNLSMEYMPIYRNVPPYYNVPALMVHPMYYVNREPVNFVHPSGIPIPRNIPVGMPDLSQSNEATGAPGLTAHGVTHVK